MTLARRDAEYLRRRRAPLRTGVREASKILQSEVKIDELPSAASAKGDDG
jgi:hypothetical protein